MLLSKKDYGLIFAEFGNILCDGCGGVKEGWVQDDGDERDEE